MAASVKKKAGVGGKKKDKKKDGRPITVNLSSCHYPIIYKVRKRRAFLDFPPLALRRRPHHAYPPTLRPSTDVEGWVGG